MGPVPCSVCIQRRELVVANVVLVARQVLVAVVTARGSRRVAGQLAERPSPVTAAFPSAGDGRLRTGVAVVLRLGRVALVSESGRLALARRALYYCDGGLGLWSWLE